MQLECWPEPKEQSDLVSFLAFTNYLREFMPADWAQYERIFAPLKKKEAKAAAREQRKNMARLTTAIDQLKVHTADAAAKHKDDASGLKAEIERWKDAIRATIIRAAAQTKPIQ